MTKEIQRTEFNRAEENKTSKGTIQIKKRITFGFFVIDNFYYTISGKYYSESEAK